MQVTVRQSFPVGRRRFITICYHMERLTFFKKTLEVLNTVEPTLMSGHLIWMFTY